MRASELIEMTDEELIEKETELKRKLFTVRFQIAMGQQENTAALRESRRDVARVKTILRKRQIEKGN